MIMNHIAFIPFQVGINGTVPQHTSGCLGPETDNRKATAQTRKGHRSARTQPWWPGSQLVLYPPVVSNLAGW